MSFRKIVFPKDLVILIILSTILNIGRVSFFGKFNFLFLFWNMFLAFIPYLISSWMLWYSDNKKPYKLFMIIGFVAWIIFLPNAPYLVTDLIHTGRIMVVPVFYDLTVLFSSALVGLLFAFYSLSHIERIFLKKFGNKATTLCMIVVIFISSFGIYLGRFIRFNSWHILTDVSSVFLKVWAIISKPYTHQDVYLFSTFFFFFIFMLYQAWKYSRIKID